MSGLHVDEQMLTALQRERKEGGKVGEDREEREKVRSEYKEEAWFGSNSVNQLFLGNKADRAEIPGEEKEELNASLIN